MNARDRRALVARNPHLPAATLAELLGVPLRVVHRDREAAQQALPQPVAGTVQAISDAAVCAYCSRRVISAMYQVIDGAQVHEGCAPDYRVATLPVPARLCVCLLYTSPSPRD